ncbi:MAG TPA: hypothetical protein VHA05_00915 [Candidatus Saccharimonadales bacterium]|nr:hypothetical protein [Candidatus Saccharimonadales bacterium]
MAESIDFRDEPEPDEGFDDVEERVIPSSSIPFSYNGINLVLTPANAAVRLFLEEGPETFLSSGSIDVIDDLELDPHSRVIVFFDDGSEAPLKTDDDDLIRSTVKGKFPVQLPRRPDESDREFLAAYMQAWTEDANSALGLGG